MRGGIDGCGGQVRGDKNNHKDTVCGSHKSKKVALEAIARDKP